MRNRDAWQLSPGFGLHSDGIFSGETPLEADDSFTAWLDEQLEELEQRHQATLPRRVVIVLVIIS
jgi:hypothetical protein